MIILGFYKYAQVKDPDKLTESLKQFCNKEKYLGTILVSHEGLNGSVSAEKEDIKALRKFLREIPNFSDFFFKEEETKDGHPFKKMKIKVKNEIVRFDHKVDLKNTGRHLSPDEFLELYDDKGNLKENIVILDTRNDYEFEIGHFKGATHLNLHTFREFTKKVNLDELKDKKVVMYCTGGVRCEKASAFVKENGIEDVSQLNQGIIQFGKVHQKSVWDGKCFVFDKRMTSPMNTEAEIVSQCYTCGKSSDLLRNCKNLKCNLFFVSCPDCEIKYDKCCSLNCQEKINPKEKVKQVLKQQKQLA